MAQATLSSKGQITIPKKIREKMNLHAGDEIYFTEEKDGNFKISSPKKSIKNLRGILHRPGQKALSVEEMDEEIAKYLKKKHKI